MAMLPLRNILQAELVWCERCVALEISKCFEHIQFRHLIQCITIKVACNNELLCVLSALCLYKYSEHLNSMMVIKLVMRLFVQIHFHCFQEHVKTQHRCENSGYAGKFFLGPWMWTLDEWVLLMVVLWIVLMCELRSLNSVFWQSNIAAYLEMWNIILIKCISKTEPLPLSSATISYKSLPSCKVL